MEADGMMRLDKFLAKMGAGSRQEVKSYIRKGMVSVNGETVSRPETKIEEEKDEIFLQGKRIAYAAFEYYMLNKPAGVISATEDKKETTVVDLIREKKRKDLFPVGRLDKDTEGLLLITNDGVLAHRLLSPNHHVDKTYFVRVHGRVTEEEEKSFRAGVNIGTRDEEEWTRPARLEILKSGEESEVRLTIQEGKYHQIKRMFQAVGMEVLYLKRLSMGKLTLDPGLKPGGIPAADRKGALRCYRRKCWKALTGLFLIWMGRCWILCGSGLLLMMII